MVRPEPADLRGNLLFAGLTEAQIRRLAGAGELAAYADGEVLFREGERPTHFVVLLSGEVVLTKLVKGHEEVVARHRPGAGGEPHDARPPAADHFLGELAIVADDTHPATATSAGTTRVVRYDRDWFGLLLRSYPQVLRVLVPVVVWRIRSSETMAMQRAAVSAVSTFAGGIAHELNNPLSAVRRAIGELLVAVNRLAVCAEQWGEVGEPDERNVVRAAQRELTGPWCNRGALDALEAAGNEERLEDWLAARHVADPTLLAGLLAERGFTVDWLAELAGRLRQPALAPALDYLSQAVLIHSLDADLDGASQRMTDIVRTARQYAKLDRTPMREVHLAADIDATLAILRHRLADMDVHLDYAADLPLVLGYPAELNEVWTNLLDNAIAATGGRGRLRVATHRDGPGVVVEIGDDGAGIPAEALPRIFEPYFTTKDTGDGTGLGLYLSHLIVTERHGGSISVESRPGDTRFLIRLPPRPERPVGGRQGVIGAIVRGETRVTQRRRPA